VYDYRNRIIALAGAGDRLGAGGATAAIERARRSSAVPARKERTGKRYKLKRRHLLKKDVQTPTERAIVAP